MVSLVIEINEENIMAADFVQRLELSFKFLREVCQYGK